MNVGGIGPWFHLFWHADRGQSLGGEKADPRFPQQLMGDNRVSPGKRTRFFSALYSEGKNTADRYNTFPTQAAENQEWPFYQVGRERTNREDKSGYPHIG
jgi:hypothetical protein